MSNKNIKFIMSFVFAVIVIGTIFPNSINAANISAQAKGNDLAKSCNTMASNNLLCEFDEGTFIITEVNDGMIIQSSDVIKYEGDISKLDKDDLNDIFGVKVIDTNNNSAQEFEGDAKLKLGSYDVYEYIVTDSETGLIKTMYLLADSQETSDPRTLSYTINSDSFIKNSFFVTISLVQLVVIIIVISKMYHSLFGQNEEY